MHSPIVYLPIIRTYVLAVLPHQTADALIRPYCSLFRSLYLLYRYILGPPQRLNFCRTLALFDVHNCCKTIKDAAGRGRSRFNPLKDPPATRKRECYGRKSYRRPRKKKTFSYNTIVSLPQKTAPKYQGVLHRAERQHRHWHRHRRPARELT